MVNHRKIDQINWCILPKSVAEGFGLEFKKSINAFYGTFQLI